METATSSVIEITDAALAKLGATADAESFNLNETYLRVSVVPGGCSGLTYDLGWDTQATDADTRLKIAQVSKRLNDTCCSWLPAQQMLRG